MGRFFRDLQRRWANIKNSFIPVPYAHAGIDVLDLSPRFSVGWAFIPRFRQVGQLDYDADQSIVLGARRDIKRVQRLDAMIGSLLRPFNGAAQVPDDVVKKIEVHVEDVKDSLTRVGAYKVEKEDDNNVLSFLPGLGTLFNAITKLPTKPEERTTVYSLEYNSYYPSPYGTGRPKKQSITTIYLGS